ncbi:MAG: hypothetical protein NC131_15635 [Roseburia sp.]|nr:hypothetical protein [Roseburia sp.]
MIHSMSGGIIADNGNLTYCKVEIAEGASVGEIRWYISPYRVEAGDFVLVPVGRQSGVKGRVLRVDNVTKQTAPYPVNRTAEVERVLK